MKIKNILEQKWKQDSPEFQTKKTNIDPETGQVTWDVEYTPLINIDKSIEKIYEELKHALKKHPDDPKLEKLFDVFAAWKKQFRTHVNRKYGR